MFILNWQVVENGLLLVNESVTLKTEQACIQLAMDLVKYGKYGDKTDWWIEYKG